MKIIDFHAHIYPEAIAKRAVESIGEFYGCNMNRSGTVSELLETEKNEGVSEFVVHSVAIDKKHVAPINEFILKEAKAHSEFHGFGTTHAELENKVFEAERVLNEGLEGIKIHPDTQRFNMDDERMFDLYDYLQMRQTPILIHCGDYRFDYSHPRRLKRVLKLFPRLKVVAAHLGGWSVYDLALEYLENESCFFDTSSSFFMLGRRRAKELIKAYGAERLVFGTDYPMHVAAKEIEFLKGLGLSSEENEMIFYKNAEKILNLK